jgi:hypothetical protein
MPGLAWAAILDGRGEPEVTFAPFRPQRSPDQAAALS